MASSVLASLLARSANVWPTGKWRRSVVGAKPASMSAAALTVEALAPLLPRKGRLIGVDLGTKTIGLALSDVERRIGTPLLTIERKKFTADAQLLIGQIA